MRHAKPVRLETAPTRGESVCFFRTYAVECSKPHNLVIYYQITRLVMPDELHSYSKSVGL